MYQVNKKEMMNIEFDIDRLMQEWRINGFVVSEEFIPLETTKPSGMGANSE